jgi:hypothetical protein
MLPEVMVHSRLHRAAFGHESAGRRSRAVWVRSELANMNFARSRVRSKLRVRHADLAVTVNMFGAGCG